jgi:uncharacterized protein YjbI with pentapeptide repeats
MQAIVSDHQTELLAHQNSLLKDQNARVLEANALNEASRRSGMSTQVSTLLDTIGEYVANQEHACQTRPATGWRLPDVLHGRIVALSYALQPYRYLELNNELGQVVLIDRYLSPERGLLLISLVASGVDISSRPPNDVTGGPNGPTSWGRPNFSYADLQGADLYGVNLSGAELTGADLSDAILEKAKFEWANCARVKFDRANLRWSSLVGGHFDEATFKRSELIGADLSGRGFSRANFSNADLSSVILRSERRTTFSLRLYGVRLDGAKLSNVGHDEWALYANGYVPIGLPDLPCRGNTTLE